MNAAQIKAYSELVKSLKDSGVTHFKCEGTEICLGDWVKQKFDAETKTGRKFTADPEFNAAVERAEAEQKKAKEEEVPHVVHELASLLKLSDNELVDQLFPEPRDPNAEQVEA